MKSTRDSFGLAVILVLMAYLVDRSLGCTPREAKEAAAETTYLGQQQECVDKFNTKVAIDECRDAVKARWASKDAGVDQ